MRWLLLLSFLSHALVAADFIPQPVPIHPVEEETPIEKFYGERSRISAEDEFLRSLRREAALEDSSLKSEPGTLARVRELEGLTQFRADLFFDQTIRNDEMRREEILYGVNPRLRETYVEAMSSYVADVVETIEAIRSLEEDDRTIRLSLARTVFDIRFPEVLANFGHLVFDEYKSDQTPGYLRLRVRRTRTGIRFIVEGKREDGTDIRHEWVGPIGDMKMIFDLTPNARGTLTVLKKTVSPQLRSPNPNLLTTFPWLEGAAGEIGARAKR